MAPAVLVARLETLLVLGTGLPDTPEMPVVRVVWEIQAQQVQRVAHLLLPVCPRL